MRKFCSYVEDFNGEHIHVHTIQGFFLCDPQSIALHNYKVSPNMRLFYHRTLFNTRKDCNLNKFRFSVYFAAETIEEIFATHGSVRF